MPAHPQPRVQQKAHALATTSTPKHPAFPHAMVLTVYSALSPATNSSCHRHRRISDFAGPGRTRKTSADLTPATGARTTRLHRPRTASFVCKPFDRSRETRPAITCSHDAAASTASRPNVRDDGQRPSSEQDDGINKGVSTKRRSGIFLERGLDTRIEKMPDEQISRSNRFNKPHSRRCKPPLSPVSGGIRFGQLGSASVSSL